MTARISLTEARRLNQIRDRLVDAVKYERTMPGLRARMVELAADVESWRDGRTTSSAAFAAARDTTPCPPPAPSGRDVEPCTESEQAPSQPAERPSAGP
jgi:hypothetical protein